MLSEKHMVQDDGTIKVERYGLSDQPQVRTYTLLEYVMEMENHCNNVSPIVWQQFRTPKK